MFYILITTGEKRSMQKLFTLKKIRGIIDKSLRQIRENVGIGR